MRGKGVLAAFLLGVGLCFVPGLAHSEISELLKEKAYSHIKFCLLDARITYMMNHPDHFLNVYFVYDEYGVFGKPIGLPEAVDTRNKVCIYIKNNREIDLFSPDWAESALFFSFKVVLGNIYSYIGLLATNMDTDIVAVFYSKTDVKVGYFFEGEYHLWEE